ncbi:MAG: mannose-6-phosphate isomerase, class I [Acidimicrobiales bacterium]|nr:mannose-6-phosphate isomerase, class I [Acidimicrobiales bacterium]
MLLLANEVRDYAWGRVDGLADLLGLAPSGGPEAELWVGTHPGAPSIVVDGDPAAVGRSLADLVAEEPVRWLGRDLAAKGFDALPFLLKVLAVGAPLSLQAHPDAEQAEAGFAREEAAGVPLDDPQRTYRDRGAKPEALVALSDTWALCGFRRPEDAVALIDSLGLEGLSPLTELLSGPDGLHRGFEWLLRLDPDRSGELARAVEAVVAPDPEADLDPADPSGPETARAWVARVSAAFPGDALAVAPLLLQVVHLRRGDSVHLPAGNLHAYLAGAGVEVMAASDNVLRGGLTPKHVDVDELLAVLKFEPGVPPAPTVVVSGPGLSCYDAAESAFGLVRVAPTETADGVVQITPFGPSLLLATDGEVDIAGAAAGVTLADGLAAFVGPGDGALEVSGAGTLWWATTGDALPR